MMPRNMAVESLASPDRFLSQPGKPALQSKRLSQLTKTTSQRMQLSPYKTPGLKNGLERRAGPSGDGILNIDRPR